MVDASRTGEAPVAVKVTDKHGNVLSKKPTIINKGDGTHTVLYVPPTEVGDESQVCAQGSILKIIVFSGELLFVIFPHFFPLLGAYQLWRT